MGWEIDVADLEAKWSRKRSAGEKCADCGKGFAKFDVPLLLWRKHGKEILALHQECAQQRITTIGTRSFSA